MYLVLYAHVVLLKHLGSFAFYLAFRVGGLILVILGSVCCPTLKLVLTLSFPQCRSSIHFLLSITIFHVCLVGIRCRSVPLRHLYMRTDRIIAAVATQCSDFPSRRFLTEAIDPPKIFLGCIRATGSKVNRMLKPGWFLATTQPRLHYLELTAFLERLLRLMSLLFLHSLGVIVLPSVDHLKTKALLTAFRLLHEGPLTLNHLRVMNALPNRKDCRYHFLIG